MPTKLSHLMSRDTQVKIDGETYTFSDLNLNAQAAIEEKFNMSLLGIHEYREDEEGNQVPVSGVEKLLIRCQLETSTLRFVAWQLLRKHHRDLTEEDVGYMIGLENQLEILKIIVVAITMAMPVEDSKKKEMLDLMSEIKTTGL